MITDITEASSLSSLSWNFDIHLILTSVANTFIKFNWFCEKVISTEDHKDTFVNLDGNQWE